MAFLSHSLGISLSFDGSRVDWVLLRTKRVLLDPPTHVVVDLGSAESSARYDAVFETLRLRLERLLVDDDYRGELTVVPETGAPFAAYSFIQSFKASRLARVGMPRVRLQPVELSNKASGIEPAAWRYLVPRMTVLEMVGFALTRKAIAFPPHPLRGTLRADFDRLRTKRPAEEDEAGLGLALTVAVWYRENEARGRPGGVHPMAYA